MASIKQTPSGEFQLCVKNKLLPKTLWASFDTRDAAEQYGAQLERLLRQGIVPSSLLEQAPPKPQAWTVGRCIAGYLRHNAVPESDVKLLETVRLALALLGTSTPDYDWAEAWVASLTRVDHLAPSTIRHRHGALARCFDWMIRKHPEIMAQNPLRLLKRGFSTYTPDDAALLAQEGKEPRFDIERDRRLEEREEHSDRGSQHVSIRYSERLVELLDTGRAAAAQAPLPVRPRCCRPRLPRHRRLAWLRLPSSPACFSAAPGVRRPVPATSLAPAPA